MICFSTPTTLDLRLLTTMGVNVKPNSASPIGYFGTGLKYAIAILLRTGHQLKLETGGKTYDFSVATEEIRGKEFSICQMHGPEGTLALPFTTEYGKTWATWMAYRELASNTWDEGGSIFKHQTRCALDETQFTVTGPEIDQVHAERDKYFLPSSAKLLHSTPDLDIYHGSASGLFYKNILVHRLEHPSELTYNFTSGIRLTEERTIADVWASRLTIAQILARSTTPFLHNTAILASEGTFEAALPYPVRTASPDFQQTAILAYRHGKIKNGDLQTRVRNYLTEITPTTFREALPREAVLLSSALDFLRGSATPITHPVRIATTLPNNILGQAQATPQPTIILSPEAFTHGLKQLCMTLLEEELHLRSGAGDETRQMQEALLGALLAEMEARQERYL